MSCLMLHTPRYRHQVTELNLGTTLYNNDETPDPRKNVYAMFGGDTVGCIN